MIVALLLSLSPGPVAPVQPLPQAERPDVLILIADDLGWGDIEPYVATPAIQSLVDQGLSFKHAYSMPMCAVTRYTLMFGRYPRRDGIGRGINSSAPPSAANPCPDPALVSLPEVFGAAGYTSALIGKWHLGSLPDKPAELAPREHGFDAWRAGAPANLRAGPESKSYTEWKRVDDGVVSKSTEYATLAQRDAFLKWWRETEGPRLAVVAFSAPHSPVHMPGPELLPEGYPETNTNRGMFEAMVISMDTAIGQILAAVDLSNTLVLFLGDNGTPPLCRRPEQRRRHLKGTGFEGGIHVPLIVAGPGVATGESRALVHTVDVLATLAGYIDQELPAGAAEDSISFLRSVREGGRYAGAREWVFAEVYSTGKDSVDDVAVRNRTHKLLLSGERRLLFDLTVDPTEEAPLDESAPRNRGRATPLEAILAGLPPRR
jgi:arylsulfatase A-like enzyme